MTEDDITEIARRLGRVYKRRKLVIATAESCTAGGVSAAITRIPGSAKWFDRGFVTYTNQAKKDMLGVRQRTLRMRGAVSEQVAHEMVKGAIANSDADVAVAVTGIAGPSGGSKTKPVGLVWFAWLARDGEVQARAFHFKGDRVQVRIQSVAAALQGLIDLAG